MSDADAPGFAAPKPTLTGGVAPVSQPTSVIAVAPQPFSSTAPSQADEVRLKPRGGTYRVPVRINDAITLDRSASVRRKITPNGPGIRGMSDKSILLAGSFVLTTAGHAQTPRYP